MITTQPSVPVVALYTMHNCGDKSAMGEYPDMYNGGGMIG